MKFVAVLIGAVAFSMSVFADDAALGAGFGSAKEVEAKYKAACANCHSSRWSRAPKLGKKKHWEHRVVKGMPQLLENVKQGFGSMPPLGMCFDCSDQQIRELIEYLIYGE